MNLTAVAAAVALAVWEIRASKQQIGRTVTSVKQGQISDAGEGGKSDSVVSVHHCGFKTAASVLGRALGLASWGSVSWGSVSSTLFYRTAQQLRHQRNL